MSDAGLISILIPAYNRPDQLFEAIQSCFAQRHRPLEILVGDDSTLPSVAETVRAIRPPPGVTLRLIENRPRLGQSGNVNALLAAAAGPRALLLHDDDLLLPRGLDRLVEEWRAAADPVCVFGKQVVIGETGAIDVEETIAVNREYRRIGVPAGVQQPSENVGLLQQIPNNCYLIETAAARRIGYRPEAEIGIAADADFGVRLALAERARGFVLVASYVSAYRVNRVSMMRYTRRNQEHQLMFAAVEALALPAEAEAARRVCLDRLGPAAVLDAANAGDPALARRIYASPHYGRSRVSPHRLVALASMAWPGAGRSVRPYLKTGVQALRRWAALLPNAHTGEAAERAAIAAVAAEHRPLVQRRRRAYAALSSSASA